MAKRNRGSLSPDRRLIWAQIIHTLQLSSQATEKNQKSIVSELY